MQCRQVIARLLHQCGRKVYLEGAQQQKEMFAYLNPVRESTTQLGFYEPGVLQEGSWLFLAPWDAGEAVQRGDMLIADGENFLLERVEKVYFQGDPAYVWGLAVRKQEVQEIG